MADYGRVVEVVEVFTKTVLTLAAAQTGGKILYINVFISHR